MSVCYLLTSSFLFNLAFIFPEYFYWTVFFYLIPIFYLGINKQIKGFIEGFIWGTLTYIVHFYYLTILVNERIEGYLKFIVPFGIVVYYATFSGLWFKFAIKMADKINSYLSWGVTTYLFIYFINEYSFFIFLSNAGYVFLNPILPLTNCSFFLKIINIIGSWFLMIFIIFIALIITNFIINKRMNWLMILMLPLVLIGFSRKKNELKKNNQIGYITVIKNQENSTPYEIGAKIKTQIIELVKNNPEIKIIVMPESSFMFPLNKYKSIINWWFDDLSNKNIHILIGGHSKKEDKYFNTVYHLYNNQLISFYDKKNLMYFVEYIPPIWSFFSSLYNYFLEDTGSFCKGHCDIILNCENYKIYPLICLDLFIQKEFDKSCDFIAFFLNESWFKTNYFKKLMYAYAILKANELNKNILYIGHEKFEFITSI